MPEIAQILAIFSMLLLLVSVGIWATILRGPLLQRLDNKRASNVEATAYALQALVFAFTLALPAAALAIAGLLFP